MLEVMNVYMHVCRHTYMNLYIFGWMDGSRQTCIYAWMDEYRQNCIQYTQMHTEYTSWQYMFQSKNT